MSLVPRWSAPNFPTSDRVVEPMPDQSKTDLVGEELPDRYTHPQARIDELAQQLEQAEQRERRYREALEQIEHDGTRDATPLGRIGYPPPKPRVELSPAATVAHAALTPDSATGQEEG